MREHTPAPIPQAIEPSINWPEARAATKNDSATWAKFIYKDIISRFSFFVVDNGSEFKGITEILFKQYGITVIFTMTYHPEGNVINECSHQTLVNSIRKSCGKDSNKWPLMVHACLLSMHCMATRVTGYTPYYLLYGRHPILAFDISDRTWDFLDWHQVKTTEELIALRTQQLVKCGKDLVITLEQQKESQKKAIDDFNKKYEKYMVTNDFDIGTRVLVHETWLDGQKGNKVPCTGQAPTSFMRSSMTRLIDSEKLMEQFERKPSTNIASRSFTIDLIIKPSRLSPPISTTLQQRWRQHPQRHTPCSSHFLATTSLVPTFHSLSSSAKFSIL